jgi:hypothetical protein
MIFIRVPVYSLGLGFIGLVVGVITDSLPLGMTLAGLGSLAGYVIWLRARLAAIRLGKAFHLGSVLNVLICTTIAVGFGILALLAGADSPEGFANGLFWIVVVLANAGAVWLHAREARATGTTRWFPTAGEVGREAVKTVFAEEPLQAAAKAAFEVGKDTVSRVRSSHLHEQADMTPPSKPNS